MADIWHCDGDQNLHDTPTKWLISEIRMHTKYIGLLFKENIGSIVGET